MRGPGVLVLPLFIKFMHLLCPAPTPLWFYLILHLFLHPFTVSSGRIKIDVTAGPMKTLLLSRKVRNFVRWSRTTQVLAGVRAQPPQPLARGAQLFWACCLEGSHHTPIAHLWHMVQTSRAHQAGVSSGSSASERAVKIAAQWCVSLWMAGNGSGNWSPRGDNATSIRIIDHCSSFTYP